MDLINVVKDEYFRAISFELCLKYQCLPVSAEHGAIELIAVHELDEAARFDLSCQTGYNITYRRLDGISAHEFDQALHRICLNPTMVADCINDGFLVIELDAEPGPVSVTLRVEEQGRFWLRCRPPSARYHDAELTAEEAGSLYLKLFEARVPPIAPDEQGVDGVTITFRINRGFNSAEFRWYGVVPGWWPMAEVCEAVFAKIGLED